MSYTNRQISLFIRWQNILFPDSPECVFCGDPARKGNVDICGRTPWTFCMVKEG